jgi:glucose-6-phosphate 1-dehydrogenase
MDFRYSTAFNGKEIPEAYERLLVDAINGDASLFTRSDEIEALWSVIDPILKGWGTAKAPPVVTYKSGTWGPKEAVELLARDNHVWRLGGNTNDAGDA